MAIKLVSERLRFNNGKVAKNGLAIAALTNTQSLPNGRLHEREKAFLLRRAKGGYGIVTTCASHVQANGKGWEGQWGCFTEAHAKDFKGVAAACQAEGALFLVQTFHGGMRAVEELIDGPVRSCVDYEFKTRSGDRKVKGLSKAEIEELISDWVSACVHLDAAGCDGIELHGAHGYILSQFQCPELNTRGDQWGGSLENRCRLTRELVRRIRAATRPEFLVGVRLSPVPLVKGDGTKEPGWQMGVQEHIQLSKWLCEDGVDFIHISLFRPCATYVAKEHKKQADPKPLVQIFREACTKDVVVMACGDVKSGEDVRRLSDLGIDAAVTGRTAIGTPDFPRELQKNADFEVVAGYPWTDKHLASVDVSPPFVDYLKFSGLVQKSKL
eukprot:TRINITY_DN44450_c0_g1_i1.p1 TRINITY_DN44450_c0_g1~~TRINITY_DN44450_c0_g1_i1.p1  ORF type:complete len:384 (-),score=69.48 TRINITY_DN44450_c0_g1_i1:133-1284(-)